MKKFLFSVADVYGYTVNSMDLLFTSRTLIDSSIETTISNEDIRSGKGNQLQFVYYHTAEFKVSLTEAQWSLEFLASAVGSVIQNNGIRQISETVAVTSGAGSVVGGTPINAYGVAGTPILGAATDANGTMYDVVLLSNGTFTITNPGADGNYCVTYNVQDTNTRYIDVNANMVPDIIRLVMKAQLGASDSGVADDNSSVIGEIEIEVPTLQLDPSASTISMTSSGVSQTPMSGRALAYSNSAAGGCVSTAIYARIKETIYGLTQYSDLLNFVTTESDIEIAQGGTHTVRTLVIPTTGTPYAPTTGLTFAIDDGTATGTTIHSTTGVVTAGSTNGVAVVTATLSNGESVPTTWTATAQVEVVSA